MHLIIISFEFNNCIFLKWQFHYIYFRIIEACNQIEKSIVRRIQMTLKRKRFSSSRSHTLSQPFTTTLSRKMSIDRKKMNTSKFSNMKSFSLVVSIVIIIIQQLSCVSSFDEKRHRAECQMWGKLENRTLPLQNQGHADCSVNDECTGFMCKGQYQVIWWNYYYNMSFLFKVIKTCHFT